MVSFTELMLLAVVVAIAIGCWLVFSRSANEKKDE